MQVILTVVLASLLAGVAAGQGGSPQPDAAEAARLNSEVVRLFREGKYDAALPLARRSVALREKLHGADHPMVAAALTNLGAILTEKREFAEAERLYLRALAVAEKSGADQIGLAADLLTRLGQLRFRAGDNDKAEGYHLRALELKEQARGAASPSSVPNLINLFEVQLAHREFDKAEAYLDRLLTTLQAQPPRKDPVAAERLKSYLCPLHGAKQHAVLKKMDQVMSWLRDPEAAAKRDHHVTPVEGDVLTGRVVSRVAPNYPASAQANRISGVVVVGITVSEEGRVLTAEPICGHPLLNAPAVEAVRGWRFTPTLLNGMPVKVTGIVTVNFVLR